jgi:CRP-like cAMP-binding protein
MKEHFKDFIYKRIKDPNPEDVDAILSIFNEKTFKKRSLFKTKDTVIKQLGFLVSGSARSYFINEKGDEITDQILQKENFLADIISIRTKKKSPIIIELIEKSDVLIASMSEVFELLNNNICFNILIREYMGDRSMELVKRHLLFLNGTAKQRYEYLRITNPIFIKKYPLKYVASMIGVTPTQLSRIRND